MKGTMGGAAVRTAVMHQFSEYAAINMMDETDVSQDGAHVVIVGGDTSGSSSENVFVYNLVTNSKGPVYTTSCTGSVNGPNNGCLHKLIETPITTWSSRLRVTGRGRSQGTGCGRGGRRSGPWRQGRTIEHGGRV